MQVTYYGFSLSSENTNVSLKQLFESFSLKSGDPVGSGAFRRLYIDNTSDTDFFIGLVVTVKDQKKFLKMAQESGRYKVKSTDLVIGESIMEFNFFVINRLNGIGLYQYYRGSCTPVTLGSFLATEFRELSDKSKEKKLAVAELIPSGRKSGKNKVIKDIRSSHHKGMKFSLIVRSGDVKDILSRYKKVVAFAYDIASLDTVAKFARPLQGLIVKARQRVRFNDSSPTDAIIEGVAGMLPSVIPNTARVTVLDDEDEPVSVRLVNMPDNFGLHDYDDLAAELDGLDLDDFGSHAVIGYLKNICSSDYPEIFMADIDEE